MRLIASSMAAVLFASALRAAILPTAWTDLGPSNRGGIIFSIDVDPANNAVLFAGGYAGLWKSINGGATWTPVAGFDGATVTAIERDPRNADTMYVGTGGPCSFGQLTGRRPGSQGLYKSTDRGATWTLLPLSESGYAAPSVHTVAVSPTSSDVILAGTDGFDGGVMRSADGGSTWSRRLAGWNGALVTVRFHPTNGNEAVAAVAPTTAGALQLHFSSNGGESWTPASGLPVIAIGHGLAVSYARSNPSIVYATSYERAGSAGTLWRSTDSGRTYTAAGQIPRPGMACLNQLWVSPTDPNLLVAGHFNLLRSTDGGTSWTDIAPEATFANQRPHVDIHSFATDPLYNGTTNRRMFVGTDGGIFRADDVTSAGTSGWTPLNTSLITSRIWDIDVAASGTVLLGLHDTMLMVHRPGSTAAENPYPFDGDILWIAFDPSDETRFFTQSYTTDIYRWSLVEGTATASSILDQDTTYGSSNAAALDPNQPDRLYSGGMSLRRVEGARYAASPSSVTVRPAASEVIESISAISVAQGNSNVVWIGQANGEVFRTTNALSATPAWTAVNFSPRSVTTRIRDILIDPANNNRVWVASNAGDLLLTNDGGGNWTSASGTGSGELPRGTIWRLLRHWVRPSRMYAGTIRGLYATENDGASWERAAGLASVMPITDVTYDSTSSTLIAGTFGRGLIAGTIPGPAAPRDLNAAGDSAGAVTIKWTAAGPADHFEIYRQTNGGPLQYVANAAGTVYTDRAAAPDTAFLYRAVAVAADGSVSSWSNADLATTMRFMDEPLEPGTIIKAAHIDQLRLAVNAVRRTARLPESSFTGTLAVRSSVARDVHVTELRAALVAARASLGLPALAPFAPIAAGEIIRAEHVNELRDGLR